MKSCLNSKKTLQNYLNIKYFLYKMLFFTSIISIRTFIGSAQVILNTHLRIRRLEDHFAGFMTTLHPLPLGAANRCTNQKFEPPLSAESFINIPFSSL